jgi:hypothetical protein
MGQYRIEFRKEAEKDLIAHKNRAIKLILPR